MTSSKIDAPLLDVLKEGELAKIMISLTNNTEELLQELGNREYADRDERLNTIQREMNAFSEKSQAQVIELLEKEKARIDITWNTLFISNQIIITGADLNLVENLAAIENVAKIEGEKFVDLL